MGLPVFAFLTRFPIFILNSLTAKPVPAGTKLILFGRCLLDLYVGIVGYILR